MIYIPMDVRLKWMQDDIDEIKSGISYMTTVKRLTCPACDFARETGFATTCTMHAPELTGSTMLHMLGRG